MKFPIRIVLFGFCLYWATASLALAGTYDLKAAQQQVEELLQQGQAPSGVVFEIVSKDSEALQAVLPVLKTLIARLRTGYAGLDVAVVSHGREMFALSVKNQTKFQQSHKVVQSLLDEQVDVHVCGTYAGMKGLSNEDFPDYVNVAAHGPERVKDYLALDYVHIKIKRP